MWEKTAGKMKGIWPYIAASVLVLVLICRFQLPTLRDYHTVDDDTCQHIYWMAEFHDKGLFQDDLQTRFAKFVQPRGFVAIYWLASFLVEPIIFTRVLPFILALVSVCFFLRFGRSKNSLLAGFFLALLLFINNGHLDSFAGGLHKAFVFPIFAIFLFYLSQERFVKAGLTTVASALFYPPGTALILVVFALSLVKFSGIRPHLSVNKKQMASVGISLLLVFLILFAHYLRPGRDEVLGKIVSRKEMEKMPEFRSGGRVASIPQPKLLPEIGRKVWDGFLLVSFGIFILLLRKNIVRLPKEGWYFLLAGIILFEVAKIFAARLYEPNRYLNYGLGIFLLLFLASGAQASIEVVAKAGRKMLRRATTVLAVVTIVSVVAYFYYRQTNEIDFEKMVFKYGPQGETLEENLRWIEARYNQYLLGLGALALLPGVLFVALTLRERDKINEKGLKFFLAAIFLASGFGYNLYFGKEHFTTYPHKGLYKFLAALPPDALIAGHPELMNPVPLFSRRRVLVTSELSHPYMDNYYQKIKKRTLKFFDAYYSPSGQEILDFAHEFGVDYLVVSQFHFSPEYLAARNFYFQPYNDYVQELTKGRKEFFLPATPEEMVLFEEDDIFVIKADEATLSSAHITRKTG